MKPNIEDKSKKSSISDITQDLNNLLALLLTHVHDHMHSVTNWHVNSGSLL